MISELERKIGDLVQGYQAELPGAHQRTIAACPWLAGVPRDQFYSLRPHLGDARIVAAREAGSPDWSSAYGAALLRDLAQGIVPACRALDRPDLISRWREIPGCGPYAEAVEGRWPTTLPKEHRSLARLCRAYASQAQTLAPEFLQALDSLSISAVGVEEYEALALALVRAGRMVEAHAMWKDLGHPVLDFSPDLADPAAVDAAAEAGFRFGAKAMSDALRFGAPEVVPAMIQAGHRPGERDSGLSLAQWAVYSLADLELVRACVEAGGDRDGAIRLAFALGRLDVVDDFRKTHTLPAFSELECFLHACSMGDDEDAESWWFRVPEMAARFTPDLRAVPAHWIGRDATDSLEIWLKIGMPVDFQSVGGGTLLHFAAWRGRVPMIQRLLEAGASVNRLDLFHSSSPLGWLIRATVRPFDGRFPAPGDRIEAAGLLAEAGAVFMPTYLHVASPELRALFGVA
ncbi:MAG: ankyrin repeat domain-containing protein [Fimbriimonadaceae bacterium]|nr:ankyrin repeat domain-containing protein [Fimbriimonadaceae bacterium]